MATSGIAAGAAFSASMTRADSPPEAVAARLLRGSEGPADSRNSAVSRPDAVTTQSCSPCSPARAACSADTWRLSDDYRQTDRWAVREVPELGVERPFLPARWLVCRVQTCSHSTVLLLQGGPIANDVGQAGPHARLNVSLHAGCLTSAGGRHCLSQAVLNVRWLQATSNRGSHLTPLRRSWLPDHDFTSAAPMARSGRLPSAHDVEQCMQKPQK